MNISTNTVESPKARSRFALSGRSAHIDPRIDAARRDLADVRLADRVFAPHYAAPVAADVQARGPLFSGKNGDGEILSEVLDGERFDVLEIVGDWCWGISAADKAVGYLPASQLSAMSARPFIVTTPTAAIRSTRDAEAGSVGQLPMATRLPAPGADGWIETATGFIAASDCEAVDSMRERDFVDVALSLVGIPHNVGGRSGAGVSSDGLVFLSLQMAGIRAPRFRDQQAELLGTQLGESADAARGDLLFFADHVAIAVEPGNAIHSDPSAGKVVRESLAELTADSRFGPVVAKRRVAK